MKKQKDVAMPPGMQIQKRCYNAKLSCSALYKSSTGVNLQTKKGKKEFPLVCTR